MKYLVYTVYDTKAEVYMHPFYFRTEGEAKRTFTSVVNDPNSDFYKNPEDYVFFQVAVFDDHDSSFDSIPPKSIGVAIEFKKAE